MIASVYLLKIPKTIVKYNNTTIGEEKIIGKSH